jgi:SAM-dependent methyltransferase
MSGLTAHSRIFKELYLVAVILEEALGRGAPKRLLEAGCGVGNITPGLKVMAREVVAFDLSAAAIATARTRCAGLGGVSFLVADGTRPKAEPAIAAGGFDVIFVREFHPFTRDFYDSLEAAREVHGHLVAEYLDLLAPGGALVIGHAEAKAQAIRPEALSLPDGTRLFVRRLDPRLLTVLLALARNRLGPAMRATRLLQPLLWRVSSRNVLYVMIKDRATDGA